MPTVVHTTLHPTAFPAMVRAARNTVTHQHARSGGSLKHIVDTFDPKSTAFFIVSRPDVVSDTLGLRPCNVIQVVRVILWRPEVRFASDEDDRNDGSTNGPNLFYPL